MREPSRDPEEVLLSELSLTRQASISAPSRENSGSGGDRELPSAHPRSGSFGGGDSSERMPPHPRAQPWTPGEGSSNSVGKKDANSDNSTPATPAAFENTPTNGEASRSGAFGLPLSLERHVSASSLRHDSAGRSRDLAAAHNGSAPSPSSRRALSYRSLGERNRERSPDAVVRVMSRRRKNRHSLAVTFYVAFTARQPSCIKEPEMYRIGECFLAELLSVLRPSMRALFSQGP